MRSTNRILAAVLAITLGWLGLHKFYMGYVKEGIITLVITLFFGGIHVTHGMSAMAVVGLIEGIIYLTRSDAEFYNTYVLGRKGWL